MAAQSGSPSPELSTSSGSSVKQAIRMLYGQSIAKDLVHIEVSSNSPRHPGPGEDNDDPETWSSSVHFTGPNYQAKKMVLLLFINRE